MKKVIPILLILVVIGVVAWHYLKPTQSVVADSAATSTPSPNALLTAIEPGYVSQDAVIANAQQGTSILFFYSATNTPSQNALIYTSYHPN